MPRSSSNVWRRRMPAGHRQAQRRRVLAAPADPSGAPARSRAPGLRQQPRATRDARSQNRSSRPRREVPFPMAIRWLDCGHDRSAYRNRPGLIEYKRVDLRSPFQKIRALDKNTKSRGHRHRRNDRGGACNHQGRWSRHHEHRDGAGKFLVKKRTGRGNGNHQRQPCTSPALEQTQHRDRGRSTSASSATTRPRTVSTPASRPGFSACRRWRRYRRKQDCPGPRPREATHR